MNIDSAFLRSFVGGIWLFRFPCLEAGPDWHYLFKSKIVDIDIDDSGLWIEREDVYPNMFSGGSWITHPSKEGIHKHEIKQEILRGREITIPLFKAWSPTILYVKVSLSGDAVIYADESELPDDIHIFQHFDKGYEGLAGLGGIF